MTELAEKIFDEKMSVRDVEKYIKNHNKPKPSKAKKENESLQIVYTKIEDELKQLFGTKASIVSKGDDKSGKLVVEFYSHDDLDRIMDIIRK